LIDETYNLWKSDLEKIFRIGTRGKKGGCNLSSCILVFIGIESFSKFFSNKKDDAKVFSDFIDKYYPTFYHRKMKEIYKLFRHGLAHNFYPKTGYQSTNTSKIVFGIDEMSRVLPLSKLRKNIKSYREMLNLTPKSGEDYIIVPQVLFIDTVHVMEDLKKNIIRNQTLQSEIVSNFVKVQKELGHSF